MRRKLVLITALVSAGIVLMLAALPWWLGAALKLAGPRFGLTFGEYRRIGYTRFALEDAAVLHAGVRVTASRVELDTPFFWVAGRPGPASVGRWTVAVETPRAPAGTGKPRGWVPLRGRLDRVVASLERRLPLTTAGAGEVTWPGGGLRIGSAAWRERRLQVTGLRWRELNADVAFHREPGTGRLSVDAQSTDGVWSAKGEAMDAQITLLGKWREQPWTLLARFGETGWKPLEAKAGATGWRLAAAYAGLGDYYDTLSGNAEVTWRDNSFAVTANAEGAPKQGTGAPPLRVRVNGSGGPERLSIDHLELHAPGIDGNLSEPVVIGRDGRMMSAASRFDLEVDLAKQPWVAGRGRVSGKVDVTPVDGHAPRVQATLSATDAALATWEMSRVGVTASLQWPVLHVATSEITLKGGDTLTLAGDWDLRTRTLAQGRMRGRVSRETVARWLPPHADFGSVEVEMQADGAWPLIAHEGRARVSALQVRPLRPLAVELAWRGSGRTLDSLSVDASAGETRLHARGVVAADFARVDELELSRPGSEPLQLVAPARLQWQPSLALDTFALKGGQSEITVQFSREEAAGQARINVRNFASLRVAEIVAQAGPEWAVDSLAIQGRWDRGPLVFSAELAGTVGLTGGKNAAIGLSVSGDAQGLKLAGLHAAIGQQPVVRAHGELPLTFHPGQTPFLRIDGDAPVSLEAATEPNALFWQQLAAATGLVIVDPSVRITVTGSLEKPLGEATLHIGKVASSGTGSFRLLPDVDDLDARLTGDRGGVALQTLAAKVAGQDVRASGRLPVKQWESFLKDPLGMAGANGEARIEIPNADVAALARYAPAYLAPTGTLRLDVALTQGGRLGGTIRLKDAATRPLGPLGILQEIGADIELDGRTVNLRQVRATAGGQPVTLSGTITLPEGKAPRLDLALRGEKLPFVRQAGLLLRGDLDLRIVTGDDETTRITGGTRLRDSLFLMDVRAFLPSGGARNAPGRRPPYFAVAMPPFNTWLLDLSVDGDRFLRLRTPVFTGIVSAHFRLGGTLGDPRATGQASINQGQVLLPFATFAVREGGVRLTEADPFDPQVSLTGTSRRYGYDLRMEVSGPAEKPQLMFYSTPSLESEQVLLMVMTGEAPQNEISYTGRDRAARLGAYLGQSLLGQIGADPTAGDRLSVNVGERVSRQGRETYGVEYELNRRWSLVGEYDEFDEYNLGLKWRVLSEKKQKEEPPDAPK